MKKKYKQLLPAIVLIINLLPCTILAQNHEVSCVAGTIYGGYADGKASCNYAVLNSPGGVIFDDSGNMYIAEQNNHIVRKVNIQGETSVFAGMVTSGKANGTGTSASFYYPTGLAKDAANNIYVADQANHLIRKITPAGVVTTLAGSGVAGSADGTGTAAQFSNPVSLAVDASGNVYVSDQDNHKVRKITPAGVVTTLAGAGTPGDVLGNGTAAKFYSPGGITIDAAGNLYISDRANNKIKKITATGNVTLVAGSTSGYTDATGASARFKTPFGIVADPAGNLYVADAGNYRIRKITATGVVSTLIGDGFSGSVDGTANEFGPGIGAQLGTIFNLTIDTAGNLYAADATNSKIRKITTAGTIRVSTVAGSGASGRVDGTAAPALFGLPEALAMDASGNLYVTDGGNFRIRKITPSHQVYTLAGGSIAGNNDGQSFAASFYHPQGITIDNNGDIYVTDSKNHNIRKITADTAVSVVAGAPTAGDNDATGTEASFDTPMGLVADGQGNLYVCDRKNNKIRKIVISTKAVTTFAGSGLSGNDDGTGTAASFNSPYAIAIDVSGNLYVTDTENDLIRKITTAGVVTTFASVPGLKPLGIAAAKDGSFYITCSNSTIYRVSQNGIPELIAGTGTSTGSINGTGLSATFFFPTAVVIDANGDLYVADLLNTLIRKITIDKTSTSVIDEEHAISEAILYPNPVHDRLYLNETAIEFFEVINTLGSSIVSGQAADNGIDVTALSPGIYLLKVKTNKGQHIHRFIKN